MGAVAVAAKASMPGLVPEEIEPTRLDAQVVAELRGHSTRVSTFRMLRAAAAVNHVREVTHMVLLVVVTPEVVSGWHRHLRRHRRGWAWRRR